MNNIYWKPMTNVVVWLLKMCDKTMWTFALAHVPERTLLYTAFFYPFPNSQNHIYAWASSVQWTLSIQSEIVAEVTTLAYRMSHTMTAFTPLILYRSSMNQTTNTRSSRSCPKPHCQILFPQCALAYQLRTVIHTF